MSIEIIGAVDKDRLYCTGSFTKLVTTFVCLSKLAEKFYLEDILDDENFLDELCTNNEAKSFLNIFQKLIVTPFTIRDLCSFYTGLPYTFDLSETELEQVELGSPFKHQSILDEKTFLEMCHTKITPVYGNQCKFHYSEISIIFLGYLIEKVYNIKMEDLYQKYIFYQFQLKASLFSRKLPAKVYTQDLSDKYDYPSIGIVDHGYFCYSNGFYTTLNDMKILIENILEAPVFTFMVDVTHARAASNRLLNGLTVEMRIYEDDVIYGYEGLSFSGCNLWAYSTKNKKGYLTFGNSEEKIYKLVYDQLFGYSNFGKVPDLTETIYDNFIKKYDFNSIEAKPIPDDFQGNYHRIKINEKELNTNFALGKNFMTIRNPDEMTYDVIYVNGNYRIKNKDQVHGAKVGLYTAKSGNKYFLYDGTLYKKI